MATPTNQPNQPKNTMQQTLDKLARTLDQLTKQLTPSTQGGGNLNTTVATLGGNLVNTQNVGLAGLNGNYSLQNPMQTSNQPQANGMQDLTQAIGDMGKVLAEAQSRFGDSIRTAMDAIAASSQAAMNATISTASLVNPNAQGGLLSPEGMPLSEQAKRNVGQEMINPSLIQRNGGGAGYFSAMGALSGMFSQAVQLGTAYQYAPYVNEAMAKSYQNQIMQEFRGGDFRSIFDFSGGGYEKFNALFDKSLTPQLNVLDQIANADIFDYGVYAQMADKSLAGAGSIGTGLSKGGVAGAGSIVEGVGQIGFGVADGVVQFQTGGAEALRGVTLAQIANARRQSNVLEQQAFDRLAMAGDQMLFSGMLTQGYSTGLNNQFYGTNATQAQYTFGNRAYNPNFSDSVAMYGGFTPDQMAPYVGALASVVGPSRLKVEDSAYIKAQQEYKESLTASGLTDDLLTQIGRRALQAKDRGVDSISAVQAGINAINSDNPLTTPESVANALAAGQRALSLTPKISNAQAELQGLMGAGYDGSEVISTLRYLTMANNYSPIAAASYGFNFSGQKATPSESLQITQSMVGFALGGSSGGFTDVGLAGGAMNAASGGLQGGNQVYQAQMSARALQELEAGQGQNAYLRATRFAANIRELQEAGVTDPSKLFTTAAALSQHSETELARRPEGVMAMLSNAGANGKALGGMIDAAYNASKSVFGDDLGSMQAVLGTSTGVTNAAMKATDAAKGGFSSISSVGAPTSYSTAAIAGSPYASQQAAKLGESAQFGQNFIDASEKMVVGLNRLAEILEGKGGQSAYEGLSGRATQKDKTSTALDTQLKGSFDKLNANMMSLTQAINNLSTKAGR